ncbi:GerMN domain-containing protein [Marinococcus halophilus]|uniref:GerMN domain-containing protein n=1 Tax=Marinococcus halophilus TaxID=1371 RepID=UPI0009A57069|nr:GerMN domain-containing protein [Marinococcus halophilus]
MKRFSFLAIAATAIITLSACGTANNENTENNENTSETASVEANGKEEEKESQENKEQADKETASEADEETESDNSTEDSSSTEENATENEKESVDSSDTSNEEASLENASPEDNATEESASDDTAKSEEEAIEESAEASEDANAETNSAPASDEEEGVTEEVTVYYLDSDLMETISETRSLEAATENDLPFEAVQAWLDGPETENAVSPLPVETEVQFVEFKGNTAYVSFEPSVLEATTVGSTLELAFVEQLSALMDQFGYGQTQILIDGEVVTDFYGHREIDQPIEAKDPSDLYGSN